MTDSIESARRFYAEELCRLNGISSPAIFAAFASVPRERFVGPGPWAIQSSGTSGFTSDADPTHVYRDALIVLDESKHLNNGQPSLWAIHLDRLHVRPGDGFSTSAAARVTTPPSSPNSPVRPAMLPRLKLRKASQPAPTPHSSPGRRSP